MDAHEVVLELAPMIVDVLFLLEMRQQFVEEEQIGLRARNGTAQAGQVVQLSEGSSEGRLPALVRSRNDEDALAAAQLEVIGDH